MFKLSEMHSGYSTLFSTTRPADQYDAGSPANVPVNTRNFYGRNDAFRFAPLDVSPQKETEPSSRGVLICAVTGEW